MPYEIETFPTTNEGLAAFQTWASALYPDGFRIVSIEPLRLGRSSYPKIVVTMRETEPDAAAPLTPPYRVALASAPEEGQVNYPTFGLPAPAAAYVPVGGTSVDMNAGLVVVTNDGGLVVCTPFVVPLTGDDETDRVLLVGEAIVAEGP
jgi:hypothetical protein